MTEQAQNIESDSGFSVKIDIFTGPIDLLLHLVKQNELPIEKVSLADICDQYMGHLGRMQDLDLEIAAEYLVIAATLLSIKASVLLNEPVEMVLDDDGNLIDPHEELLRKLREAQVYREGAFSLSCRNLLGVDVFAPPSALGGIAPPPVPLKDHDPILLGKAFRKLLERTGTSAQFMRISFEAGSIVGRMMEVLNILKREGGKVVFHRVVPEVTNRGSVIVSFIALLELCKRSVIRVQQDVTNEDIWIVLADSADAGVVSNALMESEFDEQPSAAQAVNQ